MKLQFEMGMSIFACNEFTIFSNSVFEITKGLWTQKVNTDLNCDVGGEFGTALNNEIFRAVWNKVIDLGSFRSHEWTVKVDADCVFLPGRLRVALKSYMPEEEEHGMYLNNCRFGLHGPLEVLSTRAVEVWVRGRASCVSYFNGLCSGDCYWGEDMFLDQCFRRVLQVTRVDDWRLLVEDHCAPPGNWSRCEDRSVVAFHPLKTLEGYRECLIGTGALLPALV